MPIDPPSKRRFYVGLDLGQRRDYTALVVLEKYFRSHWGDEWVSAKIDDYGTTRLMVRAIERVRLGTPYPDIVDWVNSVVTHRELQNRVVLTVDATGLGAPIVDMLRKAKLGCSLFPITITGGGSYDAASGTVPRTQLLTNLQIMIQQDKIEIAEDCSQVQALQQELRHLKLEGSKCKHDDICVALALAAWSCTKNH